MNKPDSIYLHAFNLLPQFGPARLLRLCQNFENLAEAFNASEQGLIKAGIEPEAAKVFCEFRPKINLEAERENLEKAGINVLTFRDANYPKLLQEIPKFPPLLYFRGSMDNAEELCIAVVGTRKITNYGRNVIPQLVEPLVKSGAVIVSGLAFGVDAAAHQIAIDNKQRTIAVLGGGLDDKSLYPSAHQLLAQEILDTGGALLSEYPMGTANFKQHFVARNRIISGLSIGTLVVECDLESGALITAKHSLDQNRAVYAVPGPIYAEMSKGPNNLIKMGAKLITDAHDILQDLNLETYAEQQEAQLQFGDTPQETLILQLLTLEPKNINTIIKESQIDAGEATSALTFLEMKGKVRNLGGQQYVLSR